MDLKDYLCDLGAAISKAANSLWLRSQVLSRLSEVFWEVLLELRLGLIRQVVQDADAVFCGLGSHTGNMQLFSEWPDVVDAAGEAQQEIHLVVCFIVGYGSTDVVDQRVDEVLTVPHGLPAVWTS